MKLSWLGDQYRINQMDDSVGTHDVCLGDGG